MRFVPLICLLVVCLARDLPDGVTRIVDISLNVDPAGTSYSYTCVGSKLLRGSAYLAVDAEGSLTSINGSAKFVALQTLSVDKPLIPGELAKLEELLCRRDTERIWSSMDQYCTTYYEEQDSAFTEKCTYEQLYRGY